MAATENEYLSILELTSIDADWDMGEARHVNSVQFVAGATSDVLVVKNGSATGPTVVQLSAAAQEDLLIKHLGSRRVHLLIDLSACTLSTGHKVIIEYA